MNKNYYYKNYPEIAQAMKTHNTIMPGPNFTLTDFNILCIVKSFNDAGQKCFMTNEQFANQLLATDRTVQSSIKRLCASELLEKKYIKNNIFNGKCLVYNSQKLNEFVTNMNKERTC